MAACPRSGPSRLGGEHIEGATPNIGWEVRSLPVGVDGAFGAFGAEYLPFPTVIFQCPRQDSNLRRTV